MKTLHEQEFASVCLPKLLNKAANPTRLLMATYNSVSEMDDGPVETGKSRLEAIVSSGRMVYSPVVNLGFATAMTHPDPQTADIAMDMASRAMRQDGAEAQDRVTAQTTTLLEQEQGKRLIAVVYVGVSGFDQAIDYIATIRRTHPQATIIAVSCDCNQEFGFWPHRDLINYVVFTPRCGGSQTMRALLDQIIEAWPK